MCGRTSMPPFAITEYARAICTGVTAMPCPMGTVPIVEPDHLSSGSANPADSPGKSMPVFAPNPKRSIHDASRPAAEALGDRDRPDVRGVLDDLLDGQPFRSARVPFVDHAVGDLDRGSEPERAAGIDDLVLQRSRNGHELERGARLVRVRHGSVAAAVGTRRREAVGVEARCRRHREHLARARIHDDSRRRSRAPAANRVLENLLRIRLDLAVDGQANAPSGRLGLGLHDVERAPKRVLHDRLAPGLAGERALERVLESLQALVVEPRVAEHLRGDRTLRVVAKLLGIEPEPGEVQRLEVLRLSRVGLSRNVDEASRAVDERRVEDGGIDAELLPRRQRQIPCVVDLTRIGIDGGRELPDRERLAVPVDDGAARCRHDDRLAVLPQRHRRVLGPFHDLDPGSARERGGQQDEERACQQGDAAVRRRRLHRPSWM